MQWPPTNPGFNFIKFHLVDAASMTSWVSTPNSVYIWCSSLIKAIFTSLWIFSVTLDASAIFIDGAIWMPASIIDEYKKVTTSRAFGLEPETTFFIFSIVFILSPGTILSGL